MTLFCCGFFFFILTIFNTNIPLIFHANLKLTIPNGSGEEVDFVVFLLFFSKKGPSWILDLTYREFYNSATLESDQASCKI